MRRRFAACAEIAWSGDDSASEVMLPEPIDDHAREQPTRSLLPVSQPFGKTGAAIGTAAAIRGGTLPFRFSAHIRHQHLQEPRRCHRFLLIRVTAAQEVSLRQ